MDLFASRVAPKLKANEGGYVNHPSDPGGETNHGITVRVARANGYVGPMRAMTWAQAEGIYRRVYWERPGFATVAQLAPDLAVKLADIGVNMGVAKASEFLQVGLNALNRQGRDYADIAEDGDVGPATLRALTAFQGKRGKVGLLALTEAVRAQQAVRYLTISRFNPKLEDFMLGWLTRAQD